MIFFDDLLAILTLKKINFTATNLFFFNDVDIDNIFISKKISSGKKNYKYVIGYSDEYKI